MFKILRILTILVLVMGCSNQPQYRFSAVEIQPVFQDSVSIRAIEFLDSNTLAFAGSKGVFGTVDVPSGKVRTNNQVYDTISPEFRAVAHTNTDFFMLSVGNPALLYKTGSQGNMELVYKEEAEGVFYDAMTFWNDEEGIAIGDTMNGCLSIIITRDGGQSWNKVSCAQLPKSRQNEGAFAASNTNIAVVEGQTWVATSAGRIYKSSDRGHTWQVVETPMYSEEPTQGIYSLAFYDAVSGVAVGGDYTQPEANRTNKIRTQNGGNSWVLVADGEHPGYKSCVRYVPNSNAQALVAVGFTGISATSDGGNSWSSLSDEPFYTLRFLNDSIAYAAGRNRIAKLTFRE